MRLIFLSHPQVVVDAGVPVENWHLSNAGRVRLLHFLEQNIWPVPDMIWCSSETKAQETAAILTTHFNRSYKTCQLLGENDRKATGFLQPQEFELVADQFFVQPSVSVRGWETAADAQARICKAYKKIAAESRRSDHKTIMICGHGATGTLLYCALAGLAISRQYDQPSQGHYWCYDDRQKQMLHHWRPFG